jgi:peroxiredoxin
MCFCFLSAQGVGDLGDLKEGQKVPEFQIGDYKSSADQGKPRVIIFFKAEQPISEQVFKLLADVYAKFGKRGVVFIGITDEDTATAQKTAKTWNIAFPLLSDKERSAFNKFEVFVLPSTFVVAKDGTLVRYRPICPNNYELDVTMHLAWLCGDISKEEMEKKLNPATGKNLSEKERKEVYNLNMARRLWLRGQKSLAESVLQKVQKQYPEFLPAFLQTGNWELLNKRYDKALTFFQQYSSQFPKEPDPALGMAVAYRMLNKNKEAIAALQQYEKLGGRKQRLLYEQARLSGKEAEQRDYLHKAGDLLHEELETGATHDFYEKGVTADKAKQLPEAIKYYRQALETLFIKDSIVVPDAVDDLSQKLEEHSMTKPDSTKKPEVKNPQVKKPEDTKKPGDPKKSA